jgi:FkbM family methyltransferase
MKRFWKKSDQRSQPGECDNGRISFSQCGEDLILEHILTQYLFIQRPSYLDIGAYHPTFLSNTYRFYQNGSRGVCVEPDPVLFPHLHEVRSRDVCLNAGVGVTGDSVADLYIMSSRTLNTFSRAEAERYQSYGTHRIQEVVSVPLLSVNTILEKYFDSCPDVVSLDVEGLDLAILESFNFAQFRPPVFCVETLTYAEDKTEQKITRILDLMKSEGYFAYADTYINTIFVEAERWRKR